MRGRTIAAGVAAIAVGTVAGLAPVPTANADLDIALNGTYRVISNGEWAKTNEVYMDEAVQVSMWTFATSCTDAQTCSGTVSSDKGWTVPAEYRVNRWLVRLQHPDWLRCPDGSTAPGYQSFRFNGVDGSGQIDIDNLQLLAGFDRTEGPGGACGRNTPTVIEMPLRLDRV